MTHVRIPLHGNNFRRCVIPELATAWVTLAVSADGMKRDVARALNQAERNAKINPKIDTSRFAAEADRAGRNFSSRFESASGRSAGAAGRNVAGAFVGGFAGLLAAGGLTAAAQTAIGQFKDMVNTGLDFSKTMNNFQGVTRASEFDLKRMSDAARALGGDTTLAGASASSAALAMTELAKSGFTVDEAMNSARGTLQLATAAQIDAASAAEIQANAINTFNLKATDAAHVADVLANAAIASSADIPDIGMALAQVGGVAVGFGVNIEDTASAIGMLANAGVKGSDAGTLLKTTLQSITDQGNPAQGAIEALNLSLYDMDTHQFVGFRELFRQLDEAKRRMKPEDFQAQANVLFGSDAMRGAMLGTVEDFDKMHDSIMRSGSASEMAEAQMKGLPGAIESLKNATESVQLSAFEAIGPSLTGGLNQFVTWVDGHKPELIGTFSMMAQAALGMGEVIGGVSAGIITAFAAITGGIGNSLGTIARGIAKVAEFTGADGVAKDFNEFADSAYGWGESLYTAGNLAMDAVGQMGDLRESIAAASDGIIAKEELLRALGKSTLEVFEGREIVIKNNTPQVTANLKEMGFEIRNMPDGQFELVPLTDAAKAIVDQFRRDASNPIKPQFDVDPSKAKATLDRLLASYPQFTGAARLMDPAGVALPPGPAVSAPSTPTPSTRGPLDLLVPPRQHGGIFDVWKSVASFADGKLPHQALIQAPVAGAGLVQWAEPSTGGEAFIPIDGGERSRRIWAETGRLLGVFEQGGIRGGNGLTPNAEQLQRLIMQAFPQITDIGGWRPPDGFNEHSSGQALDVMIPNPGTPEGKALGNQINQWLLQNADALGIQYDLWQQTQWNPDGTSKGMENRGGATANHLDHVHVRVKPGEATGAGLNSMYAAGGGGSYEVDQQSVFDAETRAIKARNDLEVQRKQLAELESKGTATESQLMAARNDVAEQERDVQSAEAKLTEAKQGKLKKGKGTSGGGDDSTQNFGQSLASGVFGGLMESIGLPGFSNILDWPMVKSGQAALNAFAGPIKGALEGKLGIQQPGWSPGQPIGEEGNVVGLPGGGGGGLPGVTIPGVGDFIKPIPEAGVQVRGNEPHQGTGATPGAPITYNMSGVDPKAGLQKADAHANQSYRRSGMPAVRPS